MAAAIQATREIRAGLRAAIRWRDSVRDGSGDERSEGAQDGVRWAGGGRKRRQQQRRQLMLGVAVERLRRSSNEGAGAEAGSGIACSQGEQIGPD